MRPFRICKHVEDQDGRTNRQIQEQKRALKKLPWKRKSLVLAVFVLLRGRFRERFRRNGKRDLWRYCILKIWGIQVKCRLAANAVVLEIG